MVIGREDKQSQGPGYFNEKIQAVFTWADSIKTEPWRPSPWVNYHKESRKIQLPMRHRVYQFKRTNTMSSHGYFRNLLATWARTERFLLQGEPEPPWGKRKRHVGSASLNTTEDNVGARTSAAGHCLTMSERRWVPAHPLATNAHCLGRDPQTLYTRARSLSLRVREGLTIVNKTIYCLLN